MRVITVPLFCGVNENHTVWLFPLYVQSPTSVHPLQS